MIIDPERIEDVLSGKLVHRGCGKTFAMLCVVANSVAMCPDEHLGIVFSHRDTLMYESWKFLIIQTELSGGEIMVAEHKRGSHVRFNNGCRVTFLNRNRLHEQLRGQKFDNVYIDHFILESSTVVERSLLHKQIIPQIR